MRNVTGNVVEGDDFFDREREQRLAWVQLETDNLLLLAPRRIGKTSFMRRLVATAQTNGYEHAIEVSFADCADELGCMMAILKSIEEQLPSSAKVFSNLKEQLGNIKGLSLSTSSISWSLTENQKPDWRQTGEGIAKALSKLDGKTLICTDEVPLFILRKLLDYGSENGKQRTREFLDWFRTLRQNNSQRVRWVLAGSVGLDTIAQRFALTDSINDLRLFPIGAFKPEIADQFLQKLGQDQHLPLDAETRSAVLQRIDWPLPYYLQVVFGKLREQSIVEDRPPSPAAVEAVIEELLSPAYDNYFDYWRQRLEEELGKPDASFAIALLTHIGEDPRGSSDSTLSQKLESLTNQPDSNEKLYRFLIGVLKRDGYIVESTPNNGEPRRWRFQLSLLRDWWKRQ